MEFVKKLCQCFFTWRVEPDPIRELARAEVILGQSFGHRGMNGPGTSNEVLADCIKAYQARYNLPIVLQWELAYFFGNQIDPDQVIWKHRIPGKYLDTYEVLYQSREICNSKLKGARKAIIVAHPDHMYRVVMVSRKLGFEPLLPLIVDVPYDPHSVQWWTRYRSLFLFYEMFIARPGSIITEKI